MVLSPDVPSIVAGHDRQRHGLLWARLLEQTRRYRNQMSENIMRAEAPA